MSLTKAKMSGSLKDQLLEEERAIEAEREAIHADKVKASKKEKGSKVKDQD